MGVGLDLCGIGFPRWRSSLQFSLMPATKQLVMTIQGSSPVTATSMTTPNTPSLLRSLYFFLHGLAHSTIVCHLLILAFIFALSRVSYHCYKTPYVSFFILRAFLILYFVSFFLWAFDSNSPIILGRSRPSGVRFWSSLLIALALPTCMESQSSSLIQLRSCLPLFLSLSLSLSVFVCVSPYVLYA